MRFAELTDLQRKARRRDMQRSGVILIALGLFPSASLWAGNISKNPEFGKLMAIGLAGGVITFLAAAAASRLAKVPLSSATFVAGVLVLFFAFWSQITDFLSSYWPGGEVPALFVVLLLLLALLAAVMVSSADSSLTVLSWIAAGLAAGALGQGVVAMVALNPPVLATETVARPVEGDVEKPNIFFVVLDGYARSDVLLELFEYDNSGFANYLRREGFDVPSAATANYSMSYASLASALGMAYPFTAGLSLGPDERVALYDVLSGDNPVVESLRGAGYVHFQIESGWGGTRCGDNVDKCFPAPFLDESTWALVERSVLAGAARELYGHGFPHAGLDRLDMLPGVAEEVGDSDRPVFVFAHVLLPHPPALVTEDCHIRYDPRLDGFNTGAPWLDGDEVQAMRREAYVDQVVCVNTAIERFLDTLSGSTDIVILLADHGSDAGAQLTRPVDQWTQADIDERLAPFVALRLPEKCRSDVNEGFLTVNSLRLVLRCAIGADLPDLPPRHFVVNVEENFPLDQVREVIPSSKDR